MSDRAAAIVVPAFLILFMLGVAWCSYEVTKKPVPFSHRD